MQSTLSPKTTDDPCDDVVIVADAVQVAPSDEELTSLLHQAARHRSASLAHATPELTADPANRPIDVMVAPTFINDGRSSKDSAIRPAAPAVDVMDRPAPANDDRGSGGQRSWTRHAARAFFALLLTVCIGLAAAGWKSYGAAATKMIAKLASQLVVGSSEPEEPALAAQPAVRAEAANAASEQSPPPAQAAPTPVATAPAAPDSTPLLQSMARDLAALGQEVEALKASMEQLKASQQQMSRDVAKASEQKASEQKASEQNLRPKAPTTPPRSAAAQMRKPIHPVSPPQGPAASPALPQVAAPRYVPQQYYMPQPQPVAPPQTTAEPPIEANSSVPRPPMPVR
jgi:hypothetical protein